jgi:hypothetical protein
MTGIAGLGCKECKKCDEWVPGGLQAHMPAHGHNPVKQHLPYAAFDPTLHTTSSLRPSPSRRRHASQPSRPPAP